jgi:GT2 family glycosyltransferase
MDESFFLYWEEVDWAVRAKAACGVGYAHKSVVPHVMGTTTGSAGSRAKRSAFSVYLGHRISFTSSAAIIRGGFCGPCS